MSAPPAMQQSAAEAEALRQQVEQTVREAQATAEQARAEAMRAVQAQQEAEEAFQVGPGGEIVPGEPPDVEAVTVQVPDVAVDVPPDFRFPDFPDEIMIIAVSFFIMLAFIAVGLPIARAYARRLDRRHAPPDPAVAGHGDQLRQIQTAVEAMAIEVERISENQRFVTRLLSEGEGGARPLPIERGERVPVDAGRGPARDAR